MMMTVESVLTENSEVNLTQFERVDTVNLSETLIRAVIRHSYVIHS